MEGKAGRIELLANKLEHLTNARLLVIHHVLVAHLQVVKLHLAAVVLHQIDHERVMTRHALERIGAVKPVCQQVRVHRDHDIERMAHDV